MIINDYAAEYHKPPVVTSEGFNCPVCGKSYKTESGVTRHLSKRGCHSCVHVFKDTTTEQTLMEIANVFMAHNGGRAYSNVVRFRKSRMYEKIGKILIFNYVNDINDIYNLIAWAVTKIGKWDIDAVKRFIITPRNNYEDFFNYRRDNLTDEDIEKFITQHGVQLREDANYLVRSVEKGYINLDALWVHNLVQSPLTSIQKSKLLMMR